MVDSSSFLALLSWGVQSRRNKRKEGGEPQLPGKWVIVGIKTLSKVKVSPLTTRSSYHHSILLYKLMTPQPNRKQTRSEVGGEGQRSKQEKWKRWREPLRAGKEGWGFGFHEMTMGIIYATPHSPPQTRLPPVSQYVMCNMGTPHPSTINNHHKK